MYESCSYICMEAVVFVVYDSCAYICIDDLVDRDRLMVVFTSA
jgi:hypothetical protein